MLSSFLFFVGGVAVGLGLWSAAMHDIWAFTAVYYLCALVCAGFGASLRRYKL